MAISETIAGVTSAVTALAKLATTISKTSNSDENNCLLIEFQNCIIQANQSAMSAQVECASLLALNHDLEQQIAHLANWNDKAQNYSLKEVGVGYFAYVYAPVEATTKPKHWLCATCFEDRKTSILQRNYANSFKCPNCETEIEPMAGGNPVQINDI